ncbi:TPA: insulinase family protein [Candidatus Poribacteria bacterium]|nr:insulinase family protein [Candidatus Poribacteria bacterium]
MKGSNMNRRPFKLNLDNGMSVILIEDHRSPLVSIQLFVRAGSIYEGKYLGTGVSHFVEHVIGTGTTTRSRHDIDRLIELMGNIANAYTSRDHTKYYHTVPSKYFEMALELLADYMQNPTFPPEEVEIQRGVILSELNKDNDEPTRRLLDNFYETAFRVHPVRIPIGGYRELFEKLSRDDLIDYYNTAYSPDRMTLVIAGDISPEKTREKVSELFGGFKRKIGEPISLPEEPPQSSTRRSEISANVEIAYGIMGFRTVSLFHEDVPALEVIAAILGTGESCRISRIVKDQKRLIHSFDLWSDTPAYNAGIWAVEFETDPDKIEAASSAILEEILRVGSEGVTDEELRKAKAVLESEHVFATQSIEEIANIIGADEYMTGDPNFSERMLERIKVVDHEELLRAAERYFNEDNLIISILMPERSFVTARSVYMSEKPLRHRIRRFILDNGIRLLLCPESESPVVAITVIMPGGSRYDPFEGSGAFQLMSRMLLKGTKSRTAQDIANEIESVGASLDPFCGREFFGCSASMLSKDFKLGFETLFDVLRNSIFDPEQFLKVKEEAIAEIRSESDDWVTVSKKRFYQTMFGRRAHEFYPVGELAHIEKLTPHDVFDIYLRYCVPDNMVLSIFGDIDPDEVKEIVSSSFGTWPKSGYPLPQIPPLKVKPGEATFEEDIFQEVIFLGYPSAPIGSKRRFAVKVLKAILSGMDYPGGRLYNRLRNEQSVYLIHAYTYFGPDMGYIAIYAATTGENGDQTLKAMLEEIERVRRGDISEEELEAGKNMCISNHLISHQTVSDRSASAALGESYGIGYDHFIRYEEEIGKVKMDEVISVAREMLDESKRVIVILKPQEQ